MCSRTHADHTTCTSCLETSYSGPARFHPMQKIAQGADPWVLLTEIRLWNPKFHRPRAENLAPFTLPPFCCNLCFWSRIADSKVITLDPGVEDLASCLPENTMFPHFGWEMHESLTLGATKASCDKNLLEWLHSMVWLWKTSQKRLFGPHYQLRQSGQHELICLPLRWHGRTVATLVQNAPLFRFKPWSRDCGHVPRTQKITGGWIQRVDGWNPIKYGTVGEVKTPGLSAWSDWYSATMTPVKIQKFKELKTETKIKSVLLSSSISSFISLGGFWPRRRISFVSSVGSRIANSVCVSVGSSSVFLTFT